MYLSLINAITQYFANFLLPDPFVALVKIKLITNITIVRTDHQNRIAWHFLLYDYNSRC